MPDTLPVINFINFNQTGTCISLGTSQGFGIFNCDPFGKFYSEESGGYAIVEMLFSTSLLAVVGIGDQPSLSPRRLRIINTKKHSIICEVTFPTSILSVKMNKSRLVVLLQEQIYIYDIGNMRLLHTIETNPNTEGIMAMSPSLDNCYLVYPSPPKVIDSEIKSNATTNNINVTSTSGNTPQLQQHQREYQLNRATSLMNPINNESTLASSGDNSSIQEELQSDAPNKKNGNGNIIKNGDVILFNLKTLQPTMVIEAHKGEIASLALSLDGSLLATASEKGTIIRVFNVESGIKINQFRRGTYPTKIHSMSFSEDNQFLVATCSSKTIHIFKIIPANGRQSDAHLCKHDSDDSTIEEEVIDSASQQTSTSIGGGSESTDEVLLSNTDDQNSVERSREPYVEASRRTVARMIRKSSQKFSRHAAKTLGQIFPIKVSSLLEPSRHFASLKLPVENGHGIKSITAIGVPMEIDTSEYPELFESQQQQQQRIYSQRDPNLNQPLNQSQQPFQNFQNTSVQMLPVRVVTSDGYLYNYMLDPERGGDCLLLSQYSLLLA